MAIPVSGQKIVVTGGAGFIGSHLAQSLIDRDAEVHVIDNLSAGNLENLDFKHDGRLHFHKLDILNKPALGRIFSDASHVFHMATQNVRLSLRQPGWVSQTNVEGTLNVLEAAARARVRRFVYCSSSEVNGTADVVPMPENYEFKPETIYGASKLAGEYYTQVFQRSGWLDTVIARPHNNYGPRAHSYGISEEIIPKFILNALAGLDLGIYGDGQQTRDFTFVKETVDHMIELSENEKVTGETFNVCRGQECSILEVAQKILKLTGSKSRIVHSAARSNDVLRLCGDASKLKKALGHAPSLGLDEGLIKTVEWYSNRPAAWHEKRRAEMALLKSEAWPHEDWIPL